MPYVAEITPTFSAASSNTHSAIVFTPGIESEPTASGAGAAFAIWNGSSKSTSNKEMDWCSLLFK
jgi:hypothetical protein